MTPPSPPAPPHSLIDIGANLTHPSFQGDLKDVLNRAFAAGVNHLVITGTSIDESRQAIALSQQYPQQLFATAGIHPHDARHFTADSYAQLKALAEFESVRAIGECGLDFNRMFSPKQQQIAAFEQQLALAIELKLPLFLHERDAHQQQWEILKAHRQQLSAAVIHCFTGDKQQAFRYLDLDLHIGITGWICDARRGYHLHELIRDIPLNRLMIESDAPYLVPRVKPKPALQSSRRNEPCTLPLVLAEVAKHSRYDTDTIAKATTETARAFFGINE